MLALAWAYVRFGSLPRPRAALRREAGDHRASCCRRSGLGSGAATRDARLAARRRRRARGCSSLGVNELRCCSARAGCARARRARIAGCGGARSGRAGCSRCRAAAAVAGRERDRRSAWPLFLFFLKIGSVLFGSGYVLLAFLRADLVERCGWLTRAAAARRGRRRAGRRPGRCSRPRRSSATSSAARAGAAAGDARHLPAGVRVRRAERPARPRLALAASPARSSTASTSPRSR